MGIFESMKRRRKDGEDEAERDVGAENEDRLRALIDELDDAVAEVTSGEATELEESEDLPIPEPPPWPPQADPGPPVEPASTEPAESAEEDLAAGIEDAIGSVLGVSGDDDDSLVDGVEDAIGSALDWAGDDSDEISSAFFTGSEAPADDDPMHEPTDEMVRIDRQIQLAKDLGADGRLLRSVRESILGDEDEPAPVRTPEPDVSGPADPVGSAAAADAEDLVGGIGDAVDAALAYEQEEGPEFEKGAAGGVTEEDDEVTSYRKQLAVAERLGADPELLKTVGEAIFDSDDTEAEDDVAEVSVFATPEVEPDVLDRAEPTSEDIDSELEAAFALPDRPEPQPPEPEPIAPPPPPPPPPPAPAPAPAPAARADESVDEEMPARPAWLDGEEDIPAKPSWLDGEEIPAKPAWLDDDVSPTAATVEVPQPAAPSPSAPEPPAPPPRAAAPPPPPPPPPQAAAPPPPAPPKPAAPAATGAPTRMRSPGSTFRRPTKGGGGAAAPPSPPAHKPKGPPRPQPRDIEDLMRTLRLGSKRERDEAAEKLAAMGSKAMTALIDGLDNESQAVRRWSAVALEQIGPAAKEAIPALQERQQQDPQPGVRDAAQWAIKKIQGG